MKILKAKDGFYYTNGDSYVQTVLLPDEADPKAWVLVPEEEKENKEQEFLRSLDYI